MSEQTSTSQGKMIFAAQLASVLLIWVFVFVITLWIINLIMLSIELHDAPGASVAISIIAIPIFIILASVLTYVFVGLQKDKNRLSSTPEEK